MIQAFLLDTKGYFTGCTMLTNELVDNMTDVPLTVGYVKPYFNGDYWEEGATQEEIEAWNKTNKIDICPIPSIDDRINQLEEDKKVLAENVFALAEVLEELLKGGEESGQTNSIDENTEN